MDDELPLNKTIEIRSVIIVFRAFFFCILLAFLLITVALWVAVSIYCYLLKYGAKQKHALQFHDTNNELNQVFLLII